MGGVFFRRAWVPASETINDRSRDVATLFRILQRHYPQFIETLKFQIRSRREAAPVKIAVDMTRAVTNPLADAAKETTEAVEELLQDDE